LNDRSAQRFVERYQRARQDKSSGSQTSSNQQVTTSHQNHNNSQMHNASNQGYHPNHSQYSYNSNQPPSSYPHNGNGYQQNMNMGYGQLPPPPMHHGDERYGLMTMPPPLPDDSMEYQHQPQHQFDNSRGGGSYQNERRISSQVSFVGVCLFTNV
jgi:hypothetical protein